MGSGYHISALAFLGFVWALFLIIGVDMADVKLKQTRSKCSWYEKDVVCRFHEGPPFAKSGSGHLVHRVKSITILMDNFYNYSGPRAVIDYLCAGSAYKSPASKNKRTELYDVPPDNLLVCSSCERTAKKKGFKSSSEIAGKHVHIGHMRPVQECCGGSQ